MKKFELFQPLISKDIMTTDTHFHTIHSVDGEKNELEACLMAKKAGITHISFTDHDTIGDQEKAQEEANKVGLIWAPGIEISAKLGNKQLHLLAYSFNSQHPEFESLISQINEKKEKLLDELLLDIRTRGFHIEKRKELINGNCIQGIIKGIVKDIFENLKNLEMFLFMSEGCTETDLYNIFITEYTKKINKGYLQIRDIIPAIQKSGGYVIVAHPGSTVSKKYVNELINLGINGIEVFHNQNTIDQMNFWLHYCREHKLKISGMGSDYHKTPREYPKTDSSYYLEKILRIKKDIKKLENTHKPKRKERILKRKKGCKY